MFLWIKNCIILLTCTTVKIFSSADYSENYILCQRLSKARKRQVDFDCKKKKHTSQIYFEHYLNPIQDGRGGGKKAPHQFFSCNFYKRRN